MNKMKLSLASRRDFLLQAVAGGTALCSLDAFAQAPYPTRPIRVVVPYAPGGGTDVVGRPLAQAMSTELGQPMIVDNKPGGGTVIGSDFVAKAAPDGYTLLMTTSAIAINASLVPRLPYDTDRDLTGVGRICQGPLVIACRPDKPWKTLGDVMQAARAQPGKLTYASSGNGSAVHLGAELLKMMAHVDLTHVPYRGAGPAITDVLGGQVDLIFATAGSVYKFVQAGRLRALAVTSGSRSEAYAGVPTVAEIVPGYSAEVWYAVLAPSGTPQAIVQQLNTALKKAASGAAYRTALEREGLKVIADSPQEMAAFLRAEEARWRKVVTEAKITID